MKTIIKIYLINLFTLVTLIYLIPSYKLKNSQETILICSAILYLLNAFIKPILKIVLLPINVLTLNFFSGLTNILLFIIFVFITPGISVEPWNFPGLKLGIISLTNLNLSYWQVILIGAILQTLIYKFYSFIFHE